MAMIDIVRQVVGRRSRISRTEMSAILTAAYGPLLPEVSTITGRMQDGGLVVAGQAIGPEDDEVGATASAWAEMCRGIRCISAMPGEVRYDEPGAMHPLQRAPVTFVPTELGGNDLHHIRRHADRVLLVR